MHLELVTHLFASFLPQLHLGENPAKIPMHGFTLLHNTTCIMVNCTYSTILFLATSTKGSLDYSYPEINMGQQDIAENHYYTAADMVFDDKKDRLTTRSKQAPVRPPKPPRARPVPPPRRETKKEDLDQYSMVKLDRMSVSGSTASHNYSLLGSEYSDPNQEGDGDEDAVYASPITETYQVGTSIITGRI